MYEQNIVEMKAGDLDALIERRAAEAYRLADALSEGRILATADIESAKKRLAAINDELKRADIMRRKMERARS